MQTNIWNINFIDLLSLIYFIYLFIFDWRRRKKANSWKTLKDQSGRELFSFRWICHDESRDHSPPPLSLPSKNIDVVHSIAICLQTWLNCHSLPPPPLPSYILLIYSFITRSIFCQNFAFSSQN